MRTRPMMAAASRSTLAALAALALLAPAACGGGDDGAPDVARAPARDGEVWELDRADDRATADAAMLAYVHGVHVLVLDGDEAFAGMTRLRAAEDANGGRTLTLANGLAAQLVPSGDAIELRFASGERVPLRRRAASAAPRP